MLIPPLMLENDDCSRFQMIEVINRNADSLDELMIEFRQLVSELQNKNGELQSRIDYLEYRLEQLSQERELDE